MLPRIAYLDIRPVISIMRADFPTANRWQLRSVAVYALGFRLLPLAISGVVLALVTSAEWSVALNAPTFWCFLLGTAFGFPGAALGGGPDFFVQRALYLGGKYALLRRRRPGSSRRAAREDPALPSANADRRLAHRTRR